MRVQGKVRYVHLAKLLNRLVYNHRVGIGCFWNKPIKMVGVARIELATPAMSTKGQQT
jgi:hypothetical protein